VRKQKGEKRVFARKEEGEGEGSRRGVEWWFDAAGEQQSVNQSTQPWTSRQKLQDWECQYADQ